ncbi:MAG: exodeoxyribonuclease VII large subunit, partial [Gallionellaceae bacterium]
VLREVDMIVRRLVDRVEESMQSKRYEVDAMASRLTRVMQLLRHEVERVIGAIEAMGEVYAREIEHAQDRVAGIARYLRELDPQRVLKRGFAIVRHGDSIVKNAKELDKGDRLQVQFANGTIETDVI